jgi:hypothetical protein
MWTFLGADRDEVRRGEAAIKLEEDDAQPQEETAIKPEEHDAQPHVEMAIKPEDEADKEQEAVDLRLSDTGSRAISNADDRNPFFKRYPWILAPATAAHFGSVHCRSLLLLAWAGMDWYDAVIRNILVEKSQFNPNADRQFRNPGALNCAQDWLTSMVYLTGGYGGEKFQCTENNAYEGEMPLSTLTGSDQSTDVLVVHVKQWSVPLLTSWHASLIVLISCVTYFLFAAVVLYFLYFWRRACKAEPRTADFRTGAYLCFCLKLARDWRYLLIAKTISSFLLFGIGLGFFMQVANLDSSGMTVLVLV